MPVTKMLPGGRARGRSPGDRWCCRCPPHSAQSAPGCPQTGRCMCGREWPLGRSPRPAGEGRGGEGVGCSPAVRGPLLGWAGWGAVRPTAVLFLLQLESRRAPWRGTGRESSRSPGRGGIPGGRGPGQTWGGLGGCGPALTVFREEASGRPPGAEPQPCRALRTRRPSHRPPHPHQL